MSDRHRQVLELILVDFSVGSVGEGAALGRGGMRGRRVLPVDIITRPRELVSKQGQYTIIVRVL